MLHHLLKYEHAQKLTEVVIYADHRITW